MRGCVIIIFSLLLQNPLFGQSSFSGTVKDSLGNPISNVNIIAYVDGILSHYTYSDNKGFYNLNINKSGDYSIAFSSIGFKSEEMKIYLDNRLKSKRTLDIILKKIPIELDQVVVKTKKPIIRKNDTIVFRTKFFLKGNEATVEELLKRIPDLNIDDDGTIKVGNKEIEKLMIDGDDLFGEGYKILSKNMPAYSVEEVELLKNYSKNRLLKGIEQNNKVALNLKINEKMKGLWFGNTNLSYDLESQKNYELLNNLANFNARSKHYLLSGINNLGNTLYDGLENLIRPQNFDRSTSIGEEIFVNKTFSTSSQSVDLGQGKTNFNDIDHSPKFRTGILLS